MRPQRSSRILFNL